MKRMMVVLIFSSITAGVCASPVCRVVVERTVKHSAATIANWTAWNKTHPEWVEKHPHGYPPKPISTDALALFNWTCDEIKLEDAHLDTLLDDLPPLEQTFDYTEGEETPQANIATTPAEGTTTTDNGTFWPPVFFPPIFLGGGGASSSTPPPTSVPDIPTVLSVLTGILALGIRKGK